MQSIFKIFMQGPLEENFKRISTRSSERDLGKITQGPRPGQSFVWACAIETHTDTAQEPFHGRILRENAAPQDRDNRCLCSRHALTKAVLWNNLQEKCSAPRPGQPFCASLRGRNAFGHRSGANVTREFSRKMPRPRTAPTVLRELAHGHGMPWACRASHFTQAFLRKMPRPRAATVLRKPVQSKRAWKSHKNRFHARILKENAADFARACAVEMQIDTSQEITRAILRANLQETRRRPDGAPWPSTGQYTYRRNPSVWTHCLGKSRP